ncbi:NAD(P)-binding protein [Trematosphaeria pertusa]|uniref:NAD(P)-binding protein n=1 Tax=Trematosphaeria pertusa TaxID=390896 RepID=A0A6A6HW08_9PLEO|nr:NAD(P)-binding protein [Trematosphaeria pertusa]KAF2241743.1 NAD(P)-binding protein [Trematosphaeria pertusa]
MSADIPPTMKAWTYSRAGPHRQVLSLNTIPSLKPPTGDQVLVKVAYSGLNYGDLKSMKMIPSIFRAKNSVPAMDWSGTILAVGPSAPPSLVVGMKVFGVLAMEAIFTGQGTLREYMCISTKKHMVAPVPDNCTMEEAGCIAIAATMAHLICKHAGIKEDCGLRILVNGASGGCGSGFIQAAVAMGAKEVIAICSAPNFELVQSLGATRAIDYRDKKPLHGYLAKEFGDRKIDVVVDTMGAQDLYTNSPKYLKEDGVFVNIGDYTSGTLLTAFYWLLNLFWPRWLGGTPRKFVMFGPDFGPDTVQWVQRMVGGGKMKAVIDRSVGFDQVLEVSTRREL